MIGKDAVIGEQGAEAFGDRNGPDSCLALRGDVGAGVRIPGTRDAQRPRVEVDARPLDRKQLAEPETAVDGQTERSLIERVEGGDEAGGFVATGDPVARLLAGRDAESPGRIDRGPPSRQRPGVQAAEGRDDVPDGARSESCGAATTRHVPLPRSAERTSMRSVGRRSRPSAPTMWVGAGSDGEGSSGRVELFGGVAGDEAARDPVAVDVGGWGCVPRCGVRR